MTKLFTKFKWLRRISMTAILSLFCSITYGQERQVSGTILDGINNSPLPGVSILVKGTNTGTVSDVDGKYSLSVGDTDVLIFSFIGYENQEITVGNRSIIDLTLEVDVTQLQEIVVTGYASQQKKDLTGSVGIVGAKELNAIPLGNVSNQLQGRVAGVTVLGSGEPGETSKVRIRGFGSFLNNDPLYVVDGVPTTDISTLSPNNVESISVLKDGAASIYGSRASNGVIIVTTKKGKAGISVNYNAYIGSQNPGDGPEGLLGTQGYADLQFLVYANDGTVETHPIYGPSSGSPTLPSWAANTDWYDAFTDNALITSHDISLSGGTDNAKFFAGLGYFQQDGIVNHTFNKRYNLRFNSEYEFLNDRVKIGQNLSISHRNGNGVTNLAEGSPIQMGSYRTQPIIPVIMDQAVTGISHNYVPGEFGGTGLAPRLGNGGNTVADLFRDKDDTDFDIRLIGSLYADVEIIEGLNFRTTFGGTSKNRHETDFSSATFENSENQATPNFTERSSFRKDWVWTNTLTFDKDLGEDHHILAVAGYEAVEFDIGRNLSAQRNTYFSTDLDFRTLNSGANIQNANSSALTPTTLTSQFFRGDYSYQSKYYLSATVRRDGSSKFSTDDQFGVFPSFAAAWRLSEESFLSGVDFITDLKLRAGWGQMGNQGALDSENQFFLYGGSASTSNYDLTGSGTSSLQGFRPTRIGNPAAVWEANTTTNIGFDAGLMDNKIEVIFDWYNKVTDDLLYNPELPGTAGAATVPFVNIAEMENTGIDLQLIYRNQWSDFGFEGNLTFSAYENEVTALAEELGVTFFDQFPNDVGSRIGSFTRNEIGSPISSFYGYQVSGLFQTSAEVSGAATQDGAEEGFFRYADLDPNGVIDPDDRTFIGDPNPDFTYGINLTFTYKNFDLTTFFYGSQGNDIFNWNLWWVDFWPSFQGQKSENLLNNSWTPSNTGATTPKASNKSNFSTNTQSTSYYIEDGSYLRMKNLQIGYTIPQNILDNLGLGTVRVYFQGVNLFTSTDYSGLDPELAGDDRDFGIDRGNYPTVKQFIFGLNIGI